MAEVGTPFAATLDQVGPRVPHPFGSTGDGLTEVLSIFSRPGERMHVRAQPAPGEAGHHA